MGREPETPAVVSLATEQFDAAAAILGRAFCDDPVSRYVFPDRDARRRNVAWAMRCMMRFGLRWGLIDTTADLRGVAVWTRSDVAPVTFARILQCGFWTFPVRLGIGGWTRFLRAARTMRSLRAGMSLGTHWYLMLLAVDPDCQGQGLGSLLLDRGIKRAEVDGLPCYLETATEDAARLYARHRFETAGLVRLPGSEVDFRTMVRPNGTVPH
jgi:ribosomal protein S18 acetylase RimI-like enzyme